MTVIARIRNEFSFIKENILINTISLTIILVTAAIPFTYYPKYVIGLGGKAAIVGLLGFASKVTLALVQIPGGYLADRHGRRRLIVIMTFAISSTYFLFAIAPNWQFLLIATILQNLFMIYQPAHQALVADSTPPEKRGLSFSIINLLHYISVPSPLIAGILVVQFGLISGMQIGYLIVSIAFFVVAILRMRFKETLSQTVKGFSFTTLIKNLPRSLTESIKALKGSSKPMLFLFTSFVIYNFAWFMCSNYLILYATDIVNIPDFEWATLWTWFSVVNILSALPCGKIIDKFGRKNTFDTCLAPFYPRLFGICGWKYNFNDSKFTFFGCCIDFSKYGISCINGRLCGSGEPREDNWKHKFFL